MNQKEDHIEAASALTMELEKQGKALSDFFIEYPECKIFKTAEPCEIHDLLLNLPTNSIITPNYDLLIEKEFLKKKGNDIRVVLPNEPNTLNEIKRDRLKDFLYKYHGCITMPENIVLKDEDYNTIIHKPSPDTECLKNLIQSKTFVFIGAGLKDPDFNHIRDYLIQINQAQNIEFWAFMRNCHSEVDFYKHKYGTNLINYEGENTDHSDLLNKLSELLKKINELDRKKLSDVDIVTRQDLEPTKQDGVLRQILVSANKKILPVDEQILGFVAFFDGIERTECENYMVGFKKTAIGVTNNRIDYLINHNLIKTTEHYLLPMRESFSVEAAELIEEDIMVFLAGRENG
ncbi:MAG: SIR2 family protein [Deltaproteobacteria bacterium]|jgi:hypothetical protein|nr:SIR2 family protein [Deltaproteobacteria bacterium]